MRLLALETTQRVGGVAALDAGGVLAELRLPAEAGAAQSLARAIRDLLRQVGWKPRDVQLVAVPIGPGSFTGLRVGVTTAKAFAYAAGAEILGVDTLETIAQAAPPEIARLSVAIDAQRGQVVAQAFVRNAEGWMTAAAGAELVDLSAWLAALPWGMHVSGPVLQKLSAPLPPHVTALDPALWPPTAATVGRLALRRYATGQRDDLWQLVPRYSRPSAAEEKARTSPLSRERERGIGWSPLPLPRAGEGD